jgi:hypothetical protein
MKPKYHDGPEALERFEKTMTALFRAHVLTVAEVAALTGFSRDTTTRMLERELGCPHRRPITIQVSC